MSDFFAKTFYGNTVGEWFIAIGIILGSVILSRIIYWIFGKVVKKLTAKTETRLDDIIIDMIEEPVAFAIVIIGFWYSMSTLDFPPLANVWLHRVYYLLIIFNVAWLITRLLDALLEEYLVPLTSKTDTDLDDVLLPIVRKGLKIAVWSIAVIVGLNNAGYDVGALIAGLGIGGLAFALAAQDSIANLFGGFTIFTDKPFTINDRIIISGIDGNVKEIGLRSTRLQTLEGRMVTIPNKTFANSPIENISSEPTRKVVLNLGLTYQMTDAQLEQAMQILKEIATANQDLIEENTPMSFSAFGDFALNILFIYYIRKSSDILQTQTKMNLEIYKAFNEAGLDFAYPTQTHFNYSVKQSGN